MKKIPREFINAEINAFETGSLKMTKIDENGNEIEVEGGNSICDICKKDIGDCLNAYSYHILVSEDKMVLEEKLFCTKRCWEKYLLKESEKISKQNK